MGATDGESAGAGDATEAAEATDAAQATEATETAEATEAAEISQASEGDFEHRVIVNRCTPDRFVFVEADNADAWIASDLTVTLDS